MSLATSRGFTFWEFDRDLIFLQNCKFLPFRTTHKAHKYGKIFLKENIAKDISLEILKLHSTFQKRQNSVI